MEVLGIKKPPAWCAFEKTALITLLLRRRALMPCDWAVVITNYGIASDCRSSSIRHPGDREELHSFSIGMAPEVLRRKSYRHGW